MLLKTLGIPQVAATGVTTDEKKNLISQDKEAEAKDLAEEKSDQAEAKKFKQTMSLMELAARLYPMENK